MRPKWIGLRVIKRTSGSENRANQARVSEHNSQFVSKVKKVVYPLASLASFRYRKTLTVKLNCFQTKLAKCLIHLKQPLTFVVFVFLKGNFLIEKRFYKPSTQRAWNKEKSGIQSQPPLNAIFVDPNNALLHSNSLPSLPLLNVDHAGLVHAWTSYIYRLWLVFLGGDICGSWYFVLVRYLYCTTSTVRNFYH